MFTIMVRAGDRRRWIRSRPAALGGLTAFGTVVVLGVPTGVVPSPWFERKVPVRGFEVVVLVILTAIAAAFAATYARPATTEPGLRRAGVTSGVLGWFAVSCPLCNPFVVALLGASGATGAFARLQPFLGVVAIVFAGSALAVRLRAIRRRTCLVASPPVVTTTSAPRLPDIDTEAAGVP